MNIEKELFERYEIDTNKLKKYGFKSDNEKLIYKKNILDDKFIIVIEYDKKIKGKIIEVEFNDEYTNFRRETLGEFNAAIKLEFINLLTDIRDKCCTRNGFKYNQTRRINEYINNKYSIKPEFPWDKYPGFAVYRNKVNNKWFGLVGNVKKSTLNKKDKSDELVEIINLKIQESALNDLLIQDGYYEAYHMNKKNWISIILDDTLSDETIYKWIDNSFDMINESDEWIVPANPKYYDVINCFNDTDEIMWKQSSNIQVNDIVYLYVADPYSKIMYKCKAIEVNIPYEYKDKNLSINYVMKIKLLKRLDDKNYTFKYLNDLGIKAIRGPRKITKEVSEKLK